ncbi:MAG: NIPSNAP family protein [Chloroflexi bacterium]|nr:NIPSNAP family protein [Chloroflexota bacterium]
MVYELRIYEPLPGKLPALLDRFATTTIKFFRKHGIEAVGYWTEEIGTTNRLVYLLKWRNLAHREEAWGAFETDPDWLAVLREQGPTVARFTVSILRPTAFSPLP